MRKFGRTFACASFLVTTVLLNAMRSSTARGFDQCDHEIYSLAIDYCRTKPAQKIFNAEKNIVCYDGEILRDENISFVRDLQDYGLFVVRSAGGDGVGATKIAKILSEKQIDVVVYDYCNSACAEFLFVAARRSYVAKDSIVAWHFSSSECVEVARASDGSKRLKSEACDQEIRASFARIREFERAFIVTRVVWPPSFDLSEPPFSTYVEKLLQSKARQGGVLSEIAWTWHPRYYKQALKTQVEYEAYPESQEQLDALAARLLGRSAGSIIYDP